LGRSGAYRLLQVLYQKDAAMSKGRTPPPATIDHAAQLRDRLGKAAYAQWQMETGMLPSWEQLSADERVSWQMIGQAVMDVIVKRGAQMGQISVNTSYGYDTQRPYVDLHVDHSPAQLTPGKAREIAMRILEMADASESEAILMGFARDQLELSIAEAGKLLNLLRQYRERSLGTKAESA
jgi:hypothetical protein